jgi:hypothetical protein
MGLYEGIRDSVAAPAIRQFGQAITLRVPSETSFNPDSGSVTDASPAYVDDVGYGLDIGFTVNRSQKEIGDRRFICVDIAKPLPGRDRLIVAGIEYAIANVEALSPGGVSIYYEVHCK